MRELAEPLGDVSRPASGTSALYLMSEGHEVPVEVRKYHSDCDAYTIFVHSLGRERQTTADRLRPCPVGSTSAEQAEAAEFHRINAARQQWEEEVGACASSERDGSSKRSDQDEAERAEADGGSSRRHNPFTEPEDRVFAAASEVSSRNSLGNSGSGGTVEHLHHHYHHPVGSARDASGWPILEPPTKANRGGKGVAGRTDAHVPVRTSRSKGRTRRKKDRGRAAEVSDVPVAVPYPGVAALTPAEGPSFEDHARRSASAGAPYTGSRTDSSYASMPAMPYSYHATTPQVTQRTNGPAGAHDDVDGPGSRRGGFRQRGTQSQHHPSHSFARSPAGVGPGYGDHILHDISIHTVQATPQEVRRYASVEPSAVGTGSSLLRDPVAASYHSYGTDPLAEEVAADRQIDDNDGPGSNGRLRRRRIIKSLKVKGMRTWNKMKSMHPSIRSQRHQYEFVNDLTDGHGRHDDLEEIGPRDHRHKSYAGAACSEAASCCAMQ